MDIGPHKSIRPRIWSGRSGPSWIQLDRSATITALVQPTKPADAMADEQIFGADEQVPGRRAKRPGVGYGSHLENFSSRLAHESHRGKPNDRWTAPAWSALQPVLTAAAATLAPSKGRLMRCIVPPVANT